MKTNGQDEDGEDDKEDECVEGNGLAIGLKAAKLHASGVTRKLEEKPRWEEDEE